MGRRRAPLQINKFSAGLNTEFNPLEASPDTTVEELNMEIERDGSRRKRLGFDYELNNTLIDTTVTQVTSKTISRNLYKWDNAGGIPDKSLFVTQVANSLHIFDPDLSNSISSGSIYNEVLDSSLYDSNIDFAVIDGMLLMVDGLKPVKVYEYEPIPNTITKTEITLKIRDLFGVEVNISGQTLTDKDKLSIRPATPNSQHTYNLRNQTWAYPRIENNTEVLQDPITSFVTSSSNTSSLLPSNADEVNSHYYPDANDADNRLVERFFSNNAYNTIPGISPAPKGFFIIDALERGASRFEKVSELESSYTQLDYKVLSGGLPLDKTPGGATCVGEFSGRIWYGGFSGDVQEGDSKSPRMSSYLLFSQLARSKAELGNCFQEADPTDPNDPDIVDTDGGFLRVDGAYGIKKLIDTDNALFVLAENGVWRVTGSEEGQFTATSYQVKKITNKGCISPDSVVVESNTIFYWGEDAIYYISQNELGIWNSQDISSSKIQRLYLEIPTTIKESSSGHYDGFERKIRWVYTEEPGVSTKTKELVFFVDTGAYTTNEIPVQSGNFPLVVSVGETNPYSLSTISETVTVNTVPVTVNGEVVNSDVETQISTVREVIYLIISDISPTIRFSFGSYRNANRYDWGNSVTGVGYSAYLIPNFIAVGEARYKKQVPYLNCFFRKTEDGFNPDLSPINASSCLISSRWDWTNNTNSKKWSSPRQAYRLGRIYTPVDDTDDFDSGDTIVSTRNKIRGIGHSVTFKFDSEPGKAMHIYGWSFDLQVNEKE